MFSLYLVPIYYNNSNIGSAPGKLLSNISSIDELDKIFTGFFTVAIGYTTQMDNPGCAYIPMLVTGFRILGIEHNEDGLHKFNLHGSCKADLNSISPNNAVYKSYKFTAEYDTVSRTGTIEFTE